MLFQDKFIQINNANTICLDDFCISTIFDLIDSLCKYDDQGEGTYGSGSCTERTVQSVDLNGCLSLCEENQASNCSAVTYSNATQFCELHNCMVNNTDEKVSQRHLYIRNCPQTATGK